MGVNHDGHIRSDWLPIRVTRTVAKRFAEDLAKAVEAEGVYSSYAHSGRREGGRTDFLNATTPSGMQGKSTIKVRGCDGYRAGVLKIAHRLAAEKNIRWGNEALTLGNPNAEMSVNDIDYAIINARRDSKVIRVYCGSAAYVRGYPGEVERVDDWNKMTSTLVLNIGQRQIPLLTITKVEVEA